MRPLDPRRRHRLGQTRIEIDALSLGLVPLGNLYREISDDQAHEVLQGWWDAGLRSFDVAPVYGFGIAERRLGEFLAGKPRDEVVVSTKVGRIMVQGAAPDPAMAPDGIPFFHGTPTGVNPVYDYSAEGVRRSMCASLERLGLERVDVAYIHDPEDHEEQAIREAYPALARLREDGVVGAIGVGVTTVDTPERIARSVDLDVVMLAGRYTLLEQPALESLLPALERRSVSVVVGGVLNSGFLADPRIGATYDYRPVRDHALVARAVAIRDICARQGVSLLGAALRFAAIHPLTVSVVVGAGRVDHAEALIQAYGETIPDTLWSELQDAGLISPQAPVYGRATHEPATTG